jgi:hypothetical protein
MTSAQRARCAEIARALDRGDQRLWLEAEGRMSPEEKLLTWDLRAEQVARAAQRQRREAAGAAVMCAHDFAAVRPVRAKTELQSHDLDYWSDDDEPVMPDVLPDDDNDDNEQKTKLCPLCHGTGGGDSGDTCELCDGTGRVPVSVPDDEEIG